MTAKRVEDANIDWPVYHGDGMTTAATFRRSIRNLFHLGHLEKTTAVEPNRATIPKADVSITKQWLDDEEQAQLESSPNYAACSLVLSFLSISFIHLSWPLRALRHSITV